MGKGESMGEGEGEGVGEGEGEGEGESACLWAGASGTSWGVERERYGRWASCVTLGTGSVHRCTVLPPGPPTVRFRKTS